MSDQEAQQREQFIAPDVRAEAENFVSRLASVAGDEEAVYGALRDYCQNRALEDAFAVTAAAALLIFSECITTPTQPGDYAETSFPTQPDRSSP